MRDHPKGAGDGPAITTWDEDEREQWALLCQVLQLHPATLPQDELIRELNGRAWLDGDLEARIPRGGGLHADPGYSPLELRIGPNSFR